MRIFINRFDWKITINVCTDESDEWLSAVISQKTLDKTKKNQRNCTKDISNFYWKCNHQKV